MTLGSHQKTVGDTQTWLTPRWILDSFPPFDLDPCAADPRPWDCAKLSYARDGLTLPWVGRVWLNPPFDRYEVGKWIERLAGHEAGGIALLHARTEAAWFEPVWRHAVAILFLADRIYFHRQDGSRASANSGAPACLIEFGNERQDLWKCKIPGYLVTEWSKQYRRKSLDRRALRRN